jgi:serine/threonine-protein kinase
MAEPTASNIETELTGRVIGDYVMLRPLGRGGMAEVYLAEQVSLRRPVAFKVLRANLAGDELYIKRFINEAQAAARLVHANIVQIYEVGVNNGIHFMVQEYVPGQNLKQFLTRVGHGLDLPLALVIMRQAAAALAKAAQANITHRDIKPENILLSRNGEAKIADFGLARVEGEALALTQVGLTMGTPLYMSPEQVEGKPVDPRSDLYSFGVTAFHILAGHPPFQGETALAVAMQHLQQPPPSLAKIRPDIAEQAPEIIKIVEKLLAKAPADRYASAADLVRDLRQIVVSGVDDAWESSLAHLQVEDALPSSAAATAPIAATQQLQTVMLQQQAQEKRSLPWLAPSLAAAVIFLASAAGSAIAYLNPPPSLLEFDPKQLPAVPRFETPDSQLIHARLATKNKEHALAAVAEYFPPEKSANNQRHAWLAKVDLTNYYRQTNQPAKALAIAEELGKLDSKSQAEFYVAGLAGKALALVQLNRQDEARELLAIVLPLVDKLNNEQLDKDLRALAGQYDIKLPSKTK